MQAVTRQGLGAEKALRGADWHAGCNNPMTTQTLEDTMTTQPHHLAAAGNETLPKDLSELILRIQSLPEHCRQSIEPTLERVVEFTRRRRRILDLIQDALTQLRLDMKYLVFDLEATRRERDDYRRKLEQDPS
jgi:hypothetical protein